jgi:N-acetyl-gamma-glutamylphosphate reductase
MIKVGIVGGTGYTGVELLRLLAQHPDAQITVITSRKEAVYGLPEVNREAIRGARVIDLPEATGLTQVPVLP